MVLISWPKERSGMLLTWPLPITRKTPWWVNTPDISVDYSKVLLSSGMLPLAEGLKISKTTGGLSLEWDPKHHYEGDSYDDVVMLAVYHSSTQLATMSVNAGKRQQGSCFVPVDRENRLDEPMEVYMCFKSANGKRVSDSVYPGNLNGTTKGEEKKELNEKYTQVKERFDKV